jgi:uncharacterized protein
MGLMARDRILSANAGAIQEICRRYRVRELSLFGSALGNKFGPESDFDLLVEFQPDACIGLVEYGQLQIELGSLLGRKVDLVSKPGLKPLIREAVLKTAEPIYAG